MPTTTALNDHNLPSPRSSPPRSSSPTVTTFEKGSTSAADIHDLLLTTTQESNRFRLSYRSLPKVSSQSVNKPTRKPVPPATLSSIQKYISGLEGRDKSIKFIQYSFKLLLYYRWVEAKRWSKMVSHFSQTRKILRVGHCLGIIKDMHAIYSTSSTNKHPLQHLATWCALFITLGNEVADDIYCFYRMGVLGPSVGKRAEKVSIYCWFICIWIDLKSNMESLHILQQQTEQGFSVNDQQIFQQKIFLAWLSSVKLIMDGIFCACDIWEPSFSTGAQAWTGFFSGSLSGYRLWCRNMSS